VGREGIETALFMFSAVKTSTPLQPIIGGLLGLAIALLMGYALFRGSRRLNLRLFFSVTGVLLILFAGGLLARGIHEFQEAGLFPVIVEHVWDINPVLNEKAGLGSFLKGLFGYNGNPSLIEVIAYVTYLVTALFYFFAHPGRAPAYSRR
jgi:high-affinity iron transporter